MLWESFSIFNSELFFHSITVPKMSSLINIIHFNNICIISAKLYIFDTVILWESFEVIQSEQLFYIIVVPKMNSL